MLLSLARKSKLLGSCLERGMWMSMAKIYSMMVGLLCIMLFMKDSSKLLRSWFKTTVLQ